MNAYNLDQVVNNYNKPGQFKHLPPEHYSYIYYAIWSKATESDLL